MDAASTTSAQGNGAEARNTGTNLFVTGIHPRLSEDDVTRLFSKYGEVEKCQIMVDPHTKESRGFGFVKMATLEQADAAKEGLQGEEFEGRVLSIEKARRNRPRTPTPGKYFGPPKRGESPVSFPFSIRLTFLKQMTFVVLLHVVVILTKIVAMEDALMDLAVTMMIDTLPVMMTVVVIGITVPATLGTNTHRHPPVELTVMLAQEEKIGTHLAEMTVAATTIETVVGTVVGMVPTPLGVLEALLPMTGLRFPPPVEGITTGTKLGEVTVMPTPGDKAQVSKGSCLRPLI